MFNDSKINSSDLTNSKTDIGYNNSILENKGYKLKYILNIKNPVYHQVVNECKAQKLLYKTIPIENNKAQVWIKES